MGWRTAVAVLGGLLAACTDVDPDGVNAQPMRAGDGAPACLVAGGSQPLPLEVRETSGLTRGLTHRLFWTHNDANNPAELYALDEQGRLVQRVRVSGATNTDWEDIAAARCASGGGNCLYIGDIGDNDGQRERVTIFVVPEPGPGATEVQVSAALHARYPDGARDAESLFVDRAGDIYIVTKGRSEAVELYRYATARADDVVTLERVRELFPQPQAADRVTAAALTPDGRWVAVRSYRALFLYPAEQLLGGGADVVPTVVDLRPLGQAQGESVTIGSDGEVRLTSEAANRRSPPVWSRITCSFPDEEG